MIKCGLLLPYSVPWSVYHCVSVCLSQPLARQKTAEQIEVPFGIWTRVGPGKELCFRWGLRWAQGKGQFWRAIFPSIVKYEEYLVCSGYSQPYSIGGSSDAAFHCQYCSSLYPLPSSRQYLNDDFCLRIIGIGCQNCSMLYGALMLIMQHMLYWDIYGNFARVSKYCETIKRIKQ